MNDLTTITLGRLLDPSSFRAAAELRAPYQREASRTAAALARFIECNPEVLALIAGEGVAPALALQKLEDVIKVADAGMRQTSGRLAAEELAFKERHRDCRSAALRQSFLVREQLRVVETRSARMPEERAAALKRLEDAGLDAEQIAKVELSPTQREEDELRQQEHQLRAELRALDRFVADPRRVVLGGVELHGFPVGTLPHEQDAAAQAADAQQSRKWLDR